MPKDNNSEVDKFFDGLAGEQAPDASIFDEKPTGQQAPADGEEGEAAGSPQGANEPRKNRRHRRLEEQLQTERELRIAAEAKAAGRAEAEAGRPVAIGEVPDRWIRMYGDTPESRQAWTLQKEMLDDHAKQVREDTIKEIETRQQKEKAAEKEYETFIEKELENIEDEHDVDLTSDAPAAKKARREFLEMVQSLSPKGADGSITGYADFEQTFKVYQEKAQKPKPDNTRQKEIASRGLNKSGDSAPAAKQPTPGFFGWQKDMNL